MKFSKVFMIIAMTLLMISTLIACRPANDSNFTGELDYTSNGDGTCVVSGIGTYNSEKINIPSTSPTGDTVVGIGEDAFRWCYNIKEVTLPDGVINIGAFAFAGCISLHKIILPSTVTSIGEGAFRECRELEAINIPEGVTRIEESTFVNCRSLVSVTIPSSVKRIGEWAFMCCSSLVEVCNKSSLKVEESSYYRTKAYLTTHAIQIIDDESESNIVRKGDYAFYDDGNQVLLIRYFGEESDITLPEYESGKSYNINNYAFCEKTKIVSVKISRCVSEIRNYSFDCCMNLVSVTIPTSVIVVDEKAFAGCASLIEVCNKSWFLPSSFFKNAEHIISDESESFLKRVGDYVFYDDEENVYLVKYIGDGNEVKLPEYNGGEKYEIYEWAFFNHRAYFGIPSITKIEIPDCVTRIRANAFYDSRSIEEVIIGDGVVSIDEGAFSMCTSITNVVLGKNVADIDRNLLEDSGKLVSISVDEENAKYKSIDGNLYSKDGTVFIKYCKGKPDTTFVIPDGVITVERNAAQGCYTITTLIIPNSVTTIGEEAFRGINTFEKIVIPKSVTTLGKDAFTNIGPERPDGSIRYIVYYEGTEEEYKALRKSNNNSSSGLPFWANYNYVP